MSVPPFSAPDAAGEADAPVDDDDEAAGLAAEAVPVVLFGAVVGADELPPHAAISPPITLAPLSAAERLRSVRRERCICALGEVLLSICVSLLQPTMTGRYSEQHTVSHAK